MKLARWDTPRAACPSQPSTHNSIRRRGTPDKALHLTAITSHSKLHRLAGDDRRSYRQQDPPSQAGQISGPTALVLVGQVLAS